MNTTRQHAIAFLLFVLLAVAMTWPLARVLDRAVAYPGDPYINTWILDWDWYATFHRPLSLFDANIFYPSRDSLAFSENLYGIALVLFPFRAAGISPIAAHNVAMLGGFALSGFAAYLLGHLITRNAMAAFVSGVFYAFVPYRFTHLSHVQHVWGLALPLMLCALLWYEQKPNWNRSALFAAAFLFNGLCNIHSLLFGSIAIAIPWVVVRPRFMPLAILTFASAAALILFLRPYFEVERLYGMHRSWSETMGFSARPSDWLVSNFHSHLYAPLRNPNIDPERWLFPGMLAIAIGCIALTTKERRSLVIALGWLTLGFVGSLGLHTFFHRFLFSHVPGFGAIRVPARWASVAHVGLAMLVALGAAKLAGRRAWVCFLLAAAFLVELQSAPIRWYMSVPDVPPVERWVAQAKPRALVELPIFPDSEYAVMLHATAHHRPMVNGISGFTPPISAHISDLAHEWSDRLVPELHRLGVTHLIVHADAFDDHGRAWLAQAVERGELGLMRKFDAGIFGDWLFSIGIRGPVTPELAAMLRGEPVYSETTFGVLDRPLPEETLREGAVASGFAFSPYGIRAVNLLVNNGAVRLPTELREDAALKRQFPWYDATTRPRFVAKFPERPPGVWMITDMQPEIIDGRGKRTLLEDRWISWR